SRNDAVGAGGIRPARAALQPPGCRAVHAAAATRLPRHADGVAGRSWGLSHIRAGCSRSMPQRDPDVRIARLHGRGGEARLSERARVAELDKAARLAIGKSARRDLHGPGEARADEAGSAIRGRELAEA